MSSITLDTATVEQLKSLGTPVEVRDPQGRVVGVFRPLPPVYPKGEMPDLSEEELQRRFTASPRLSTAEVLQRLEGRL